MSKNDRPGLVAQMRAALGEPAPLGIPASLAISTPAERRAALALRIIVLGSPRAQPMLPTVAAPALTERPTLLPSDETLVDAPAAVALKPRKPARVSLTTVRLEDAASLLTSVDLNPAPAPAPLGRGAAAMMAAAANMAALQSAETLGDPGQSDPFSAFDDDTR